MLVPIYLLHRYQTEAASKLIGGFHYSYEVPAQNVRGIQMLRPAQQERALRAVLRTLDPVHLALPAGLLRLLTPPGPGYRRRGQRFRTRLGVGFDALGVAEAAAQMTLSFLLHPERAARLVEFHARDPKQLGFTRVLDELLSASWKSRPADGYPLALQHAVQAAVVERLFALATRSDATHAVRARSHQALTLLRTWLEQRHRTASGVHKAHYDYWLWQLATFLRSPSRYRVTPPANLPPGSPIGCGLLPGARRDERVTEAGKLSRSGRDATRSAGPAAREFVR